MDDDFMVHGRTERLRTGTAEIFQVTIESDEPLRRALDTDPAGTFQRFFESQGHAVNGVELEGSDDLPHLGGGHWAHDNSEEERSHWFPIYE